MATISVSDERSAQFSASKSWGAAILAGLPHFLMGLLIAIGKFLDPAARLNQNLAAIAGTILGLLVIGMLLFAWRRGWPLWSASWYLYGAWVTLAIINLTIDKLNLHDSWRYTNALFLICVLVCIVGYFALLQKSKLHGLLSIAFLFPLLSVQMIEFVPNPIEGWLAISLGLLSALAAGEIVRIGDFRFALLIVLGINLAAGVLWAYISEYKMLDLPAGIPAHIPQFGRFLEFFGFYAIFGLGIIILPFILRGLWNFGKNKLAS